MSSLARLMTDVGCSVQRADGPGRARALARLTDLFVVGADGFGEREIEVFDAVMQLVAAATDAGARVKLAERLAPLAAGPRGMVLTLARDEILVARPVLARSPRLDDQDLMAIALELGRDHMLAICDRPVLSEPVTDVLVQEGDGVVRHAVASNLGARFSVPAVERLLEHGRQDAALQELLRDRPDLPAAPARRLVEIATATARRQLARLRPAAALVRGPPGGRADEAGEGRGLAGRRDDAVTEADLARYAAERRTGDVLAALATLTGLPPDGLERLFDERDNDLLLVIGKARGWSWRTVRLLLGLRDPRLTERHHFRRAEETFDGLATATAQRVLHFLKVREAAAEARGGLPPARRVSGAGR